MDGGETTPSLATISPADVDASPAARRAAVSGSNRRETPPSHKLATPRRPFFYHASRQAIRLRMRLSGSVAFASVVDRLGAEMHSSCLVRGFAPGSRPETLASRAVTRPASNLPFLAISNPQEPRHSCFRARIVTAVGRNWWCDKGSGTGSWWLTRVVVPQAVRNLLPHLSLAPVEREIFPAATEVGNSFS